MASSLSRNQTSLIPNSPPAKRQRTDNGYTSTSTSATNTASNTRTYNSDADSGDDLFEGYIPDTPAVASARYETQPTQIIDRSTPNLSRLSSPPETAPRNKVQVPASSPLTGRDTHPLSTGVHRPVYNGVALQKRNLAMSMAPAGTVYKPPHGIINKPTPTKTFITIDDDDVVQIIDSDSSEDELRAQADIKPSLFKPKSAQSSFGSSPPSQPINGNAKFQNIVSHATYKGPAFSSSLYGNHGRDFATTSSSVSSGSKPMTSDSMSIGYGSTRKPLMQMKPERAAPIQDITVDSLDDAVLREKVTRLRMAFPMMTVLMCRNALIRSRGNVDDAANLLAGEPTPRLGSDEIECPRRPVAPMFASHMAKKPESPQMKRILDAPLASLKDRYSSTQAPVPKPAAVATPPPKKKKLVQFAVLGDKVAKHLESGEGRDKQGLR